jgi:uncharacterized protein YjiK
MRWAVALSAVLLALVAGCAGLGGGDPARAGAALGRHEGQLIVSFPIEGEFGVPVEPSGLAFHDGFLYTVSDEHDDMMFKLEMSVDEHAGDADLTLIGIPLAFAPGTQGDGMDFEGIASDRRDGFYVLSEEYARVFHMDLQDATLRPVTPSLLDRGKRAGLFRTGSAGFEGMAFDGERLVLCAERRPRAVVEFGVSSGADPQLVVQKDVRTRSAFPEGADADFAGLFSEDGALYVLERNAYAVCRLRKVDGRYVVDAALSYGKAIDDHNLRYQRKARETIDYGRGEGLALDPDRVYVVLDNNGRPLKSDPDDARARLLVLRRPEGF